MERSNQPPKTEDCLAEGLPVDLLSHRRERPSRSVSREKCEPQAGPASGSSDSASKRSSASGDGVVLSESNTELPDQGEGKADLPGSESVARMEGTTRNEGDPQSSCRTKERFKNKTRVIVFFLTLRTLRDDVSRIRALQVDARKHCRFDKHREMVVVFN